MSWEDGEAPEGWLVCEIGEVATVVGGGTPKTTVAGNFSDIDGHPWVTPADLTGYTDKYIARGRRFLTDQGLATSSAKYMPAGTVLFSSRAPIGYTAIASNPVTTNQGFRSFVPSDRLDSGYLFHALRFLRPIAEHLASGTTFPELSGSNAARMHIAFPPSLEEQRGIADILDHATASGRSAADHLSAARRLIERLRQSVLMAACSGRLTMDWREAHPHEEPAETLVARIEKVRRSRLGSRFRESSLPTVDEELPDGWTWTTIGALVEVATGATPLRKRAAYYNGSIPWVTSGAVNAGLIRGATEHITELAIKETNAKVFPAGTLVVAMYGEGQTRGRVAELGIDAATNQALAALLFDEPSERIRPYLRLFLLENYERIRQLSFGGVQPNLSLGVIRDTLVPLPPESEQDEIVHRVDEILNLVAVLRERIEIANKKLARSSQAILSKAFRGELSPVIGQEAPAFE